MAIQKKTGYDRNLLPKGVLYGVHAWIPFFFLILTITSCNEKGLQEELVITSDIQNFWKAYDAVNQETDSLAQVKLIDSLYVRKGTKGLSAMMEARNYTSAEYVQLMKTYPKYWQSLKPNTLKSDEIASELDSAIEKLRVVYPPLKPAKIYFTVGCMRSNGTTKDSLVLIGSELAMADSLTDISEFEGRTKEWLENYFATDPINALVLLNIHEYVHTQQNPTPDNLLHIVLYEGIAEFVSTHAMDTPSAAPAVAYGKSNPAVKEKFEKEMFYERTFDWLWSNSPNEFNVRDLGYYIGYEIAERHFNNASDKAAAIAELIELDYSDRESINQLIDGTQFFSKPIETLEKEDRNKRPNVEKISPMINGSQDVKPGIVDLTVEFSEKLNGYNTGLNYSDLGEDYFPDIVTHSWAPDSLSWNMQLKLSPNKNYKFWITHNFRTKNDIPILPYLIEFKTGN